MKRFVLFTFLFFVMMPAVTVRAAEVSATVDKTRVVSGESLTLTVSIEGGKGEVNVTGIRDFEVVSRGTSSSYNIINGNVSRKTAYTFTLIPVKQGRLLIPPLPVSIGKQAIYTELIAVEVSDSRRPGAASEEEEVFVRLSVSDADPYLGEQITCRLSLYTAAQIANAAVTRPPDFPGFSVEQLADSQAGAKVVGGRHFNVTELVYVLTPESAGTHSIGPAVITCDIVKRSAGRDRSRFDSFFNDPFFGGGQTLEKRRLTADAVKVTVRPLPQYSGADPFSGLVGEFAVSAEIDETEIAAGDSCNIAVTISGRGNIKAASSPRFDLPDAFKVYKDAPVEDITVGEAGVSGKKRFSAALVALTPGKYTLGPFSLTYFDVSRKSYITIATAPIDMTVKETDSKQTAVVSGTDMTGNGSLPMPVRKQAVEFTGKDIFPIKEELTALKPQGPIPPAIFGLLTGGPFLLYFLAGLVATRLGRKIDDSTLMARKARAALKAAQNSRAPVEDRLDLLFKAVVYAVYARAGRKGESLTYREARQLLENKGCKEDLADTACRLLEQIEQARYAGQAVDRDFLEKMLESAGAVIRRIAL